MVLIAALWAYSGGPPAAYLILKRLRWAALLTTFGYAISILISGLGANSFLQSRPYALFAGLSTAAAIGMVRYKLGSWFPVFITAAIIFLSLSRTSLASVLVIVAVSGMAQKRGLANVKALLPGILIFLIFCSAVLNFAPLRQRFFLRQDVRGSDAGAEDINTSGRGVIWAATMNSATRSEKDLIVGQGPGSSERFVAAWFPESASHPHNDFLRVLHDYGAIGLVMFLISCVSLISRSWIAWSVADRRRSVLGVFHCTAFCGQLFFMLLMLTENPIVYPFAVIAVGIMSGLSAGIAANPRDGYIAQCKS